MKHRWSEGIHFPIAHKTERTCLNGCGITKVSRHETEGGRDVHWTEFYQGEARIHCEGTPACSGTIDSTTSYDARSYPL